MHGYILIFANQFLMCISLSSTFLPRFIGARFKTNGINPESFHGKQRASSLSTGRKRIRSTTELKKNDTTSKFFTGKNLRRSARNKKSSSAIICIDDDDSSEDDPPFHCGDEDADVRFSRL